MFVKFKKKLPLLKCLKKIDGTFLQVRTWK